MFSVPLRGDAVAQKKPKMTLAQFMRELAKHRGEFKVINIWHQRCSEYTPALRAGRNRKSACPITKVYSVRQNKPCGALNFLEAAEKLGLNQRTRDMIVGAADGRINTPARKKHRRQMLKVLGLKEVT